MYLCVADPSPGLHPAGRLRRSAGTRAAGAYGQTPVLIFCVPTCTSTSSYVASYLGRLETKDRHVTGIDS